MAADDLIDISYKFVEWDEADPGDGIPFNVVLAAEAVGVSIPKAVVARLALLRDTTHTAAVAVGAEQPDLIYIRFAHALQARAFGEHLIRAAENAEPHHVQ